MKDFIKTTSNPASLDDLIIIIQMSLKKLPSQKYLAYLRALAFEKKEEFKMARELYTQYPGDFAARRLKAINGLGDAKQSVASSKNTTSGSSDIKVQIRNNLLRRMLEKMRDHYEEQTREPTQNNVIFSTVHPDVIEARPANDVDIEKFKVHGRPILN